MRHRTAYFKARPGQMTALMVVITADRLRHGATMDVELSRAHSHWFRYHPQQNAPHAISFKPEQILYSKNLVFPIAQKTVTFGLFS